MDGWMEFGALFGLVGWMDGCAVVTQWLRLLICCEIKSSATSIRFFSKIEWKVSHLNLIQITAKLANVKLKKKAFKLLNS